jgi:hypothetical protein
MLPGAIVLEMKRHARGSMMARIATFGMLIVLSLCAAPSVTASEADPIGAVKAAQQALDRAYQSRDIDAIKRLTTPTHLAIVPYFPLPFTVDQQFAVLDSLSVDSFDAGDAHIRVVSGELVIMTFEKAYEGTFEDKPLPARVFTTGIWIKSDGVWRQELYQETTAP